MSSSVIHKIPDWLVDEIEDQLNTSISLDSSYVITAGDGFYIQAVTADGSDMSLTGQLSIFGETASKLRIILQIMEAEDISELPAGLVDEDDEIRELAIEKFGNLEGEEKQDER